MEPSDDFPAFPFGGICDRSLEGSHFHSTCLLCFFEVEVHEGGGSMVKTREPTENHRPRLRKTQKRREKINMKPNEDQSKTCFFLK